MYDYLIYLTEKMNMSGVSFQKINDEDGATMQTAVTVTTPDVNGDVKETIVETVPADIHLESSQPAPNVNTLSWPKAKPALVQNAFSSPTGGILESVAALSRQTSEPEIRERNPVRLDVLFTVIGR